MLNLQEDHDFNEINNFTLSGKTFKWESNQTGMVGDFNLKNINDVLDEFENFIVNTAHGKELGFMVKEAYLNSKNLAEATRVLVNKIFKEFGEIYFSTIYKNAVKGWHLHKESYLNYACIQGEVKLTLFDNREGSKTKNKTQEIILSPLNYSLVTIPPNIWNGFKGLSENESIIANCLTIPHNENEMIRKDPKDKLFNYEW